jgi:hypothetical protein
MRSFLLFFILFLSFGLKAQETITLYNPEADAHKDLEIAIQKAQDQRKHVLIQVGGNWCPWCVRLHGVFESEAKIDSILKSDYVFILINYSKENKNEVVLADLGFPQRFGFRFYWSLISKAIVCIHKIPHILKKIKDMTQIKSSDFCLTGMRKRWIRNPM